MHNSITITNTNEIITIDTTKTAIVIVLMTKL